MHDEAIVGNPRICAAVVLAVPAHHALGQPGPSDLVVIDFRAGTDGRDAMFVVRPTGARTLFTDFGNPAQGPVGQIRTASPATCPATSTSSTRMPAPIASMMASLAGAVCCSTSIASPAPAR